MLEPTGGLLVGVAVSWLFPAARPTVVVALLLWLWFGYHVGTGAAMPTTRPVRFDAVRRAGLALGLTTLVAAAGLVPVEGLPSAVLVLACATATAGLVRGVMAARHGTRRVLLVGDRVAVTELASRWRQEPDIGVVAACVHEPDLDDDQYPSDLFGAPVLRSIREVPQAVSEWGVDGVVVIPSAGMLSHDVRELDWSLAGLRTPLAVVGPPGPFAPHRVRSGKLGGRLLMHVVPNQRSSTLRLLKALSDRLVGTLLLVLALPLLAVLCVLIRLDSPGSPLFRQTRVGMNGRHFTMLKLRTMRTDAEQHLDPLRRSVPDDQVLFKLAEDPRITRVGRFLRRSSLDELPQLVNVVRGEMSLIGPRPGLPAEVARYDASSRHRLVVRPGMTGLWQVSGRSDLGWEESVGLDLDYVDNWRFSDDVLIAARTFGAVLSRRGAY